MMKTFVGAEYIIANMLIAMDENHKGDSISLAELCEAGVYIQKLSNENGLDAIFLYSMDRLATAIHDFSDYFEYDPEGQEIRVVRTKRISNLKSRFVGYLPFDVVCFLSKAADQAVITRMQNRMGTR